MIRLWLPPQRETAATAGGVTADLCGQRPELVRRQRRRPRAKRQRHRAISMRSSDRRRLCFIIPQSPSQNGGSYPPIQPWPGLTPPAGFDVWPDELEQDTFQQYNGFVVLTVVRGVVSSYQPNTEAWESWQASRPPEPEPGPAGDTPTYADMASAIKKGANSV